MTRTVGTVVGESLASLHRGPVFGVSGSGNFVPMEAFDRLAGRYIAANHEAAAVTMADGWAQISGEVGVASLHQGPGFTNALTAIVDSAKERVPLLILAAELGPESERHHQYLNQAEVLRAVGSRLTVLTVDCDDPAGTVREGLSLAASGPTTVVVRMPVEALARSTRPGTPSDGSIEPRRPDAPSPADVRRVKELMAHARRPVLLVGRGGRSAAPDLEAMADRMGARIATTLAADGLFSACPRHIGFLGGFAPQTTLDALADCDLLLGFGTSLDDWTTIGGALLASRTVVSIAQDPPHAASAEWVRSDVAAFLRAFSPTPDPGTENDYPAAQTFDRDETQPLNVSSSETLLSPQSLFMMLNELLPESRTIALDSGHFMAWAGMFLRAGPGGVYLVGQGFQSVGLGLARGIGSALADPRRTTVAVVGDGGFYMGLSDLETAVRVGAPLLVVVVNDSGYGAEIHDFEPAGYSTEIVRFPPRDIARAASGLGAHSRVIHRIDDLAEALKHHTPGLGPLVLDCRVDPAQDAADAMTALGRAHWTGRP